MKSSLLVFSYGSEDLCNTCCCVINRINFINCCIKCTSLSYHQIHQIPKWLSQRVIVFNLASFFCCKKLCCLSFSHSKLLLLPQDIERFGILTQSRYERNWSRHFAMLLFDNPAGISKLSPPRGHDGHHR